MSLATSPASANASQPGQLVRVRGRHWVVADVSASADPRDVRAQSVESRRRRAPDLPRLQCHPQHGRRLRRIRPAKPPPLSESPPPPWRVRRRGVQGAEPDVAPWCVEHMVLAYAACPRHPGGDHTTRPARGGLRASARSNRLAGDPRLCAPERAGAGEPLRRGHRRDLGSDARSPWRRDRQR